MASGTMKKHVNPPDTYNMTKEAVLTNDQATLITSKGGWYQVRAINTNTAGSCYAYILHNDNDQYMAAAQIPGANNTYSRAVTSWLYFPSGRTFYARRGSTYANDSGLYYAPEL